MQRAGGKGTGKRTRSFARWPWSFGFRQRVLRCVVFRGQPPKGQGARGKGQGARGKGQGARQLVPVLRACFTALGSSDAAPRPIGCAQYPGGPFTMAKGPGPIISDHTFSPFKYSLFRRVFPFQECSRYPLRGIWYQNKGILNGFGTQQNNDI